jgi:hypothetical protein
MRKPIQHPVFGKLGATQPVGVVAAVRSLSAPRRLMLTNRILADKSARNWIVFKFAICVWAVAIVFVIFGWWPA